ncbi:hypothetical protein DH2020_009021 [Rehmannia glutinosa]|uniref:Uncharacterized protein n=1 Tax=Rehmannia glutinosa TaxID=99300 RepID=A0ABR0VGL6_REHGL
MASLKHISILFAGALCLLSFSGAAHAAAPQFIVEGAVFCEVCRTNFINKLSEPMPGATVRLECRGEEKGNLTYSLEGVTGIGGRYRLTVDGDHGDEQCEVTLVKSSRPDCQEIPNEGWAIKPSSKVIITTNSGFHDDIRHANPLGFTKKQALPKCVEFLKELDINSED